MHYRIVFGALLISLGSTAFANPYLGGTAGKVDYSDDELNSPTGFEIKLGGRVHRNLALELSYIDFGDAEDDLEPVWEYSTDAVALAALAIYPLSKVFELNIRVGGHHWDTQVHEAGFGKVADLSGTDLHYGVGMGFKPSEHLQLGLNYIRYEVKTGDIYYPNASFNYYFK